MAGAGGADSFTLECHCWECNGTPVSISTLRRHARRPNVDKFVHVEPSSCMSSEDDEKLLDSEVHVEPSCTSSEDDEKIILDSNCSATTEEGNPAFLYNIAIKQ